MGKMVSQITSLTIVYSTVYSGADHKEIFLHRWPLCGEITGDRWIPCTNGQLRGKCFRLMTSSTGCLMWVPRLAKVLHLNLLCGVQYLVILYRDVSRVYSMSLAIILRMLVISGMIRKSVFLMIECMATQPNISQSHWTWIRPQGIMYLLYVRTWK